MKVRQICLINSISKKMSLCLQPQCLTVNSPNSQFCHKCGVKLLLDERYRAIKKIGEGGFGKTFKAIDEYKPSHPVCVIKQFFPQAQGTSNREKAAQLFAQEGVRLDELGQHPQIPELLAYFSQDGQQYLVQEFIEGQNLLEELNRQGKFNESKIRQLLVDILAVLKFVHGHKVIHRDIKPENIIRGSSDRKLVLVDFGASKIVANTSLSVTGTIIGSAQYTSPEQAMGKPKYASDLYSLGVTCLHLLTGVEPFDLYDVSEGDWAWGDFLVNNPVSDELRQILDKLVESALKRRYKSAGEVLAALNPIFTSPPSPPPQPPTPISNLSQLKTFEFETVRITVIKTGFFGVKKLETKSIRKQARYFTENLGNGVTIDLVYIPSGTFIMGSPQGEGYDHEKPQHQVRVQAFFMGKYPITQAQWQEIASRNDLKINGELELNPSKFKGENRPVETVSWYEAVEFGHRLSTYTGREYRLPSEAEWEYACRAMSSPPISLPDGEGSIYPPFYFGETFISDLANNNGEKTTPVGQFPPNAFGLYDMHGLVWEWCEDDWHNDYQHAPNNGSAWLDMNDLNSYKVLRGGSWIYYPDDCRAASRNNNYPDKRKDVYGFRVVCGVGRTFSG